MKVYKKKNGKFVVLSEMKTGRFGGTEVIFLNYSLKGTLQSISNFNDYTYLREPTFEEIEKYYNKLNGISLDIITPTDDEIKKYSK
jgi:hypothetical protein